MRGANATPRFNALSYCPRRSSKAGHVDLIGLVVAGERVHDDVDAGAERHFALARLAVDHRQHRLAVGARRPGAGKVIGGDKDR